MSILPAVLLRGCTPRGYLRAAGEDVLQARKYTRIATTQRCSCESMRASLFAQIGNVSEGGVFIQTYAPLAVGESARLRFELEGELLEADAVVTWRRAQAEEGRGPGMGLRFEALAPEVAGRLRAFVAGRQI